MENINELNELNELNESSISIDYSNNNLDIKIHLQNLYDVVDWEQEHNQINILNVQSLEIDCYIEYIELDSEPMINFLNNVLTKAAENLNNISIKFSINNCITDEDSDDINFSHVKTGDYCQNIVDALNRWMQDLSKLQESFKTMSRLTYFSFTFSLDEATHYKFSDDVSEHKFIQLYYLTPIVVILKSQSVHKTLHKISLNLEYVNFLSEEQETELFSVFSMNPRLEILEINSKDGFLLPAPDNKFQYYIKDLTLVYNNCIYDLEALDDIKEIVSAFPLSNLKLHISSINSNKSIEEELHRLDSLRKDLIYYSNLENISLSGNDFDRLPEISKSVPKRKHRFYGDNNIANNFQNSDLVDEYIKRLKI